MLKIFVTNIWKYNLVFVTGSTVSNICG